ncbi:MAG: hypothetical protein FAF05_06675 [Epsilonproteobacteria bacterium]|nr:hypothetical protein [Campylobacterota bacterium]
MQTIEVGVQKWFRRFGLFSLTFFLLPLSLFSQSFAEFKNIQSASFESFKDERDNQFNKYLKEQWQEYEAYKSPSLYEKPKPKQIDKIYETPSVNIGPRINIPLVSPQENNKTVVLKPKVNQQREGIFFFGTYIGFNIDANIKKARFYPQNQNGIVSFFHAMASSDYEYIITVIKRTKKQLQLNDWGVYQLVATLAQSLYRNRDEQKLLQWFMLSKLGFDLKVALAHSHIVLLVHTKQLVYATPRYKFDGSYYYAINYSGQKSPGRVYAYEKKYPDAEHKLDFSLKNLPLLEKNLLLKKLHFSTIDGVFDFKIHLNKNLIDFMQTYPQVAYDIYFNAKLEPKLQNEIMAQFRQYLNGKKASYGVNFVLRFVQKSFKYQRDVDQFGKEKVMFAQETLYYDKSDCEDRAILFARLIRELFQYRVLGLKYADHISTALYIPVKGDSVTIGSRKYVIADPTYINANVGKSMPRYQNTVPQKFIYIKQ